MIHVKVHERKFVKEILDKEIVVKNVNFYTRRNENRVKLTIDVDNLNDVYVSTSAEMIIEAAHKFKQTDFPFAAKIVEAENGYYKFK